MAYQQPDDIHIWGFTSEEQSRADRLVETNPELESEFPLIEAMLTKQDCLAILNRAGIELPMMYKLGYTNNNCIGCVKGYAGYWNKIRVDFPEVFNRMAQEERRIGYACIRKEIDGKKVPIFLDELDPGEGNYGSEPDISCSILCEIAIQE